MEQKISFYFLYIYIFFCSLTRRRIVHFDGCGDTRESCVCGFHSRDMTDNTGKGTKKTQQTRDMYVLSFSCCHFKVVCISKGSRTVRFHFIFYHHTSHSLSQSWHEQRAINYVGRAGWMGSFCGTQMRDWKIEMFGYKKLKFVFYLLLLLLLLLLSLSLSCSRHRLNNFMIAGRRHGAS